MSKLHRTGHSLKSRVLCDPYSHPEVLLVLPRGGWEDPEEGCDGQTLPSVTQTPPWTRFVPLHRWLLHSQGPRLHLLVHRSFLFYVANYHPHQPLKSSFKEVCSDNSKVESRESTHQDWGANAVCEERVLTAWGPKPKLQNPQFERLGEFSCILHPAHPRDEITQTGRELFSLCNFSVNLKSF